MLWCLHRKTEENTTSKQSLYYRNRFLTWLTHVQTEPFVHFAGQPNYGILLYHPQHNELVVLHNAHCVFILYDTRRYYTTLYFVIAWALSTTFRSYEMVYFLSLCVCLSADTFPYCAIQFMHTIYHIFIGDPCAKIKSIDPSRIFAITIVFNTCIKI